MKTNYGSQCQVKMNSYVEKNQLKCFLVLNLEKVKKKSLLFELKSIHAFNFYISYNYLRI